MDDQSFIGTRRLDPRSVEILEHVVSLRALVRQLDAPTLRKHLNDAASILVSVQRDYAKSYKTTETAVEFLEHILAGSISPHSVHIQDFVKQYRFHNPKKD